MTKSTHLRVLFVLLTLLIPLQVIGQIPHPALSELRVWEKNLRQANTRNDFAYLGMGTPGYNLQYHFSPALAGFSSTAEAAAALDIHRLGAKFSQVCRLWLQHTNFGQPGRPSVITPLDDPRYRPPPGFAGANVCGCCEDCAWLLDARPVVLRANDCRVVNLATGGRAIMGPKKELLTDGPTRMIIRNQFSKVTLTHTTLTIAPVDIGGTWVGPTSSLVITQNGANISAALRIQQSAWNIAGTVSGTTLHYNWAGGGMTGSGTLELGENGQVLSGPWTAANGVQGTLSFFRLMVYQGGGKQIPSQPPAPPVSSPQSACKQACLNYCASLGQTGGELVDSGLCLLGTLSVGPDQACQCR